MIEISKELWKLAKLATKAVEVQKLSDEAIKAWAVKLANNVKDAND